MSRKRKIKSAAKKDNGAPAGVAAQTAANGAASAKVAPEQTGGRPGATKPAMPNRHAEIFANAVAVLMRDPAYRELRLRDLETFLIPAILCGQCVVAQAPSGPGGAVIPVGVAIWASLSSGFDKRMAQLADTPPRLNVKDFRSGDHIWMIALAGDKRAVPRLLAQLAEREFKGRDVKMRTTARDGKKHVRLLAKASA